ncbi:hypothetical protein J3R83DRAFT_10479 [Lanmaoa asiatica]|nr:hypothetical protein J3R83DRAFT_10479 [Lanmaoa asiatica]
MHREAPTDTASTYTRRSFPTAAAQTPNVPIPPYLASSSTTSKTQGTMNVFLRSNSISLITSDYELGRCEDELWRMFRRTAVEPGQAPSPEFVSFADECLLCANIVVNPTSHIEDERGNDESLWNPHSPEGNTQTPPPPSAGPLPLPPPGAPSSGLIYLYAGPANLPAGEANIGVIMRHSVQRRGYAREAVRLVLRWAFEDLKFHRVQAAILDTPFKDKALRLFIGSGFTHEGTKRRAVYQPEGEGMAGMWKDVTYLAMLDTEWMLRSTWKRANPVPEQPVISVWDEMFTRHSREREELLQWEENHGRVRRSSSTETLKENTRNMTQDLAYLTDEASSFGEPSISGSLPPSPRPNVVVTWDEDTPMADALGPDEFSQRWEEVIETTLAARRQRQGMGGSLLGPSLRGHMLALPSIPSTRVSEGNLQSPLTIPSSSTPGSTPPSSPSPAPPSIYSSWTDSEDEDNWLPRETPPPTNTPVQSTMPHNPYPPTAPASLGSRPRSSSLSSSSADSWSDAQSSAGAYSSNWDVISNTSVRSHRGRV